jgi:hypothetical protein
MSDPEMAQRDGIAVSAIDDRFSGSRLLSSLRCERRDFSISLASSGGFTLTHWFALDVGIHDRVPRFGAGSSGG